MRVSFLGFSPALRVEVEQPARAIVWNPSSPLPPTRVYRSVDQAQKVSEAMAGKNPGQTFWVAVLHCAAIPTRPLPGERFDVLRASWNALWGNIAVAMVLDRAADFLHNES